MFKKSTCWIFIIFLSFNISLLKAGPVDVNFTQKTTEIKSSNNELDYLMPQEALNSTRLVNERNEQINDLNGLEQISKSGLNRNVRDYYIKSNYENKTINNTANIKSATLMLDYTFDSHLKSAQLITKELLLTDNDSLLPPSVNLQSVENSKSYLPSKINEPSIQNLDEVNREDIAYIEEELLYSKEAGVSYDHDDTSEAVRLLTINSLNLDDKTLIWAVLLLLSALFCIAIYVRFFKD